MSLWNFYLRWRHSKGFGVHSPFAYKFVTDVLNPGPYAYYSFQEIDKNLYDQKDFNRKFVNLVKLTIRIVNFLNSKRIVSPFKSTLVKVAAMSAGKDTACLCNSKDFKFKPGDLLLIESEPYSSHLLPAIIDKAIESQVSVFALNPSDSLRKKLETPLSRGLLFSGKKRVLLIPRSEMAYISYRINL